MRPRCRASCRTEAVTDTPFLHRVSAALAYPLRGDVLGILALCAGARLLSYYLQSSIHVQWLPDLVVGGDSGSVFAVVGGLGLDLIVLMLAFKVAVEAMLDTAQDRQGADGQAWHVATDRHAAGQLFLLVALFLPAYLLALWEFTPLAWAWLAAGIVAWPAAAMLEAMEENFLHALNPLAWLALLGRLGADYLGAVVAVVVLIGVALGLEWLLLTTLPGILAAALARFLQMYALLVAFKLFGQLLRQRHEALGLDIAPPIVKPQLANAEEDEVMQRAQWLLDQGEPAQAIDCLHDLIRRRGASAPVHACYRQLLVKANDVARLAAHTRLYAGNLLALGQDKVALALVGEALRLDRGFLLDDPDAITRLLAHAAKTGQSQIAVDLGANFETRFPKSADIPANGLTVARLLAERFGRDADARQLLLGLATRYREHPLAPDIAAALDSIGR